jgi:arylsulfate sulfotransferase
MVGIVLLISITFIIGLQMLPFREDHTSSEAKNFVQTAVKNQLKTDAEIQSYIQQSQYSIDNPLVVQNPYDTAPLTALIIFDTAAPVEITLHIPGNTPQAAVDFTFAGLKTHHEIPVYGLYPGTQNHLSLATQDMAGAREQFALDIQSEPLPVFLTPITILNADPQRYSAGMNFAFVNNKLAYDINGDIRWFSNQSSFQTFMRLKNGHFLFNYPMQNDTSNVLMEEDLLGRVYAVYDLPDGVHHDIAELPNGNLLVTSEDHANFSKFDILLEIDRKSGDVVRKFDLSDFLDATRPHEVGLEDDDWLHMNSIFYDEPSQSILISGRSQSAVIKLTYPDMKVVWILGPPAGWSGEFQPYLLTARGELFDWSWAQHHATIVSQTTVGEEHFVDVLLFDNGNDRSFDPEFVIPADQNFSRMVRYHINETTHTVEQVWQYGKESGSELFSTSRGSAYWLGNGDYFGTWSELIKDPSGKAVMAQKEGDSISTRSLEIDPTNNQVIFEAEIANAINYRTLRADFYTPFALPTSLVSQALNDTTQLSALRQVEIFLQPAKAQLLRIETWVKGACLKVWKWACQGKM